MMFLSGGILFSNVVNYYFFITHDVIATLATPSVWVLGLLTLFFGLGERVPSRVTTVIQPTVFLLLSGPMVLPPVYTFFGFWFFLIGVVLYYRYGFLARWPVPKLLLILAYFAPFFVLGIVKNEGGPGAEGRIINYSTFLISCFAFLFIIFEDQIRDLLASNRKKDLTLADQAATIARLEPLSVLGERVAHVTHSFKNNLSQLGTALFYLEQGNDPDKARQKIEQFSKAMSERIDNILMVSRAGADQSVELFDAARVLSGMNQVYLTEPAFLHQAQVNLDISESTPVEAVRWDFLLLVENILKNALEALTARGRYGQIQVTLKDRVLILANDGGAIELCSPCHADSCLDCPKYGKPGRTGKAGGTGHGLAQVFATCRKYGWTLRIRAEGDWTRFEIGFPRLLAVPARPS